MLANDIVAEAASWKDTPYKWRAATKHIGADCGSYVHAVKSVFYDIPPLPSQRRESWVTEEGGDYWERYLEPIAERLNNPLAGCGVLFKYGRNYCHGGIVDQKGHVWHCWGRKGMAGVSRSNFGFFIDMHGRPLPRFFWRIRDEFLRA